MLSRLSSFSILAVCLAALLAWGGRPGDSAFPNSQAGKLEVTGAFFAYCSFDEECGDSRILQLGKSPTQFVIDTAADKSLKGATIDFTVELLTTEGKSVFDTGFSLEHEHIPRQRSRLLYKKQPPAIGKLAPGKYVYRVVAQTADGKTVSEWKRVVEARK